MQGGPFAEKKFRKKIRKKCLAVPKKNERGDSLVSPGMICYAEKQVNSFWSSSLGQMVLFDTIISCRTFKKYFGQFVWIEKKKKKKSHYNSRVSLHEAPTKNVGSSNLIAAANSLTFSDYLFLHTNFRTCLFKIMSQQFLKTSIQNNPRIPI